MNVPILSAHEAILSNIIGKCTLDKDGRPRVQMIEEHALTRKRLFDAFGNCGILVHKMIQKNGELTGNQDDDYLIVEFTIMHFVVEKGRGS